MSAASLAGVPRIPSGLDFIARFEPAILLNGLVSGDRARRILLEVVRRVAADRPADWTTAFDRLQDLDSFLNNTTSPGVAPLETDDLRTVLTAALAVIDAAEPWTGPARYRPKTASPTRLARPGFRNTPHTRQGTPGGR